MAGRYLIIDMSGEAPQLVSTDEIIPEALRQILSEIRDQLGVIMSNQAGEQAQLSTLADGMNAAAAHITSAAGLLQQWIADNATQPLDFSGANAALASLNSASATLDGIVPQAPDHTLDTPVADPGPPPTVDDVPAEPQPDIGTVTVDTGAGTDTMGTDTGAPPPDEAPTPT